MYKKKEVVSENEGEKFKARLVANMRLTMMRFFPHGQTYLYQDSVEFGSVF